MFKSIMVSITTTILVIVFALVGIDTIVESRKNNMEKPKNISYKSNDVKKVEFINEETSSVVPTNSVVGIAVKQNSGNKIAQIIDNSWSVGSGCILDSKGYIVTNYHVIGISKDEIYVTLYHLNILNAILTHIFILINTKEHTVCALLITYLF